MAVELIQCPMCGAVPSTPPGAGGAYVCAYCGAHFEARTAAPKPAAEPPRRKTTPLPFVAGIAACVLAGIAAALLLPAPAGVAASISPISVPTVSAGAFAALAPEKDEPATATFEFEGRTSAYQSSFYVLGFVTNTSPFAVDKPKVTAVLHDQANKEVSSSDGYAEFDTLAPGAIAPVKLLVETPPPFKAMTFEVVARKASYHAEIAPALTVEISTPPHQVLGSWELTGKVHNGGATPVRFVHVEALAFDRASRLVGVDSTFADGESLPAGADARFRITPLYDAAPARFQYSVSGQLVR